MALNSKIEWTDNTLNLWWGCSHVHRGCDNCYAEKLANRWGHKCWDTDDEKQPRRLINSALKDLQKMERRAFSKGVTETVFVGSMMDIFEKSQPLSNPEKDYTETGDLRRVFFDSIFIESVNTGCYPSLIFLLLTKRPSNINKMVPESWLSTPPQNVWFGASVVDDQSMMDVARNMDRVNGKTFWSVEPLLQGIDIRNALDKYKHPDWIIVGGESGPGRRPFDLKWAEKIQTHCLFYNIPYFFKQVDKVIVPPERFVLRQFPKEFGKKDVIPYDIPF